MAFLNLVFYFIKSITSTPPKTIIFEMNSKIIYGLFLSYILTYLIYAH